MILGLRIENIAVIEKASLEFSKGLNVMTGETGAGKSIIIDAINAVLGERTSRELIRTGCEEASVTASFTEIGNRAEEILSELGIDKTDDSSLLVSRKISANGKNSCRVNGMPVTVSVLKQLGSSLINIHGQHDSQELLLPESHLVFIDRMAGNSALREEYKAAFSSLIKTKKELDALYDARDELTSRLDYLDFMTDELLSADIHVGETDELNKEKTLIQNSANVRKLLEKASSALSTDGGICDALNDCVFNLAKAAEVYSDVESLASGLKGTYIEVSDYASRLRDLIDKFSYSPERLKEIDDRLDLIYRLSMKYGNTEADMLEALEKALKEKNDAETSDERIKALEEKLYACSDKVKALASELTAVRKKTAEEFEKKVTEELKFLDMSYVVFKAHFTETSLSARGAETVEFLISTNPGQNPGPLSKIASGGELSRIMLAIKNVLSDKDYTDTLIFDEIDAGVSGSAADKIALKLDQVSVNRQVICVTHLARIAAQADNHLKIEKTVSDGNTFTNVESLNFEERARELARINSGNNITDLQLRTAVEMLEKAKETKK